MAAEEPSGKSISSLGSMSNLMSVSSKSIRTSAVRGLSFTKYGWKFIYSLSYLTPKARSSSGPRSPRLHTARAT